MPTDGSWNTKEPVCDDDHHDEVYDEGFEAGEEAGYERGYADACSEYERQKNGTQNTKPNQWSTKTGGTDTMNRTIAKLFEKTADAVLVNKFYGHIIQDNDVSFIILNGKQKELLAAANVLQAKQDANANVVTAKIVA